MSLTVCLLTRNEATTVARAVNSVRNIADEVLVADTGSTDGTVEAAANAGAVVMPFSWEDDFAAGRNFLVERATGDWILWLDAKEELLPESIEPLRRAMNRDDAFGFFLSIHRVDEAGRGEFSESADLRVFRRRADLRFVGRLHPHLEPATVETVKREGLTVGPCSVALRHYENPGMPPESKLRWIARLIELELHDRPGQLHYLIEQGRTLLMLKDPRGHDVMAAAAEQVRALRDAPTAPSAKTQVLLRYVMTSVAAQSKTAITPDEASELALRWFPNSPGLLWLMAEQRFRVGEYEGAMQFLDRLLHLGKTGTYDRSQPFDPQTLGEKALLNLGVCYLKLGRGAEAEACFLQLLPSPAHGLAARRHLESARRIK